MPSQKFTQSAARKSYDGVVRFATDNADGSVGSTYAWPDSRFRFTKSDNNGYVAGVDNSGRKHIRIPGVRYGVVELETPVMPDRGIDTFLTSAFGPRSSGRLLPWLMNLAAYNGATIEAATGVFWSRCTLYSQFGVRGDAAQVVMRLLGYVADPDNHGAAGTLVAAAGEGLNGKGAASFSLMSFSNGASISPTAYDNIDSFSLTLDNNLSVIRAMKDPVNRICAGWAFGELDGALMLDQLKGAAQAVPKTAGTWPLTLNIPTGDNTSALRIDTSVSYDSDAELLVPEDLTGLGEAYTLFDVNTTNLATAWPFAASYA